MNLEKEFNRAGSCAHISNYSILYMATFQQGLAPFLCARVRVCVHAYIRVRACVCVCMCIFTHVCVGVHILAGIMLGLCGCGCVSSLVCMLCTSFDRKHVVLVCAYVCHY